MRQLLIALLVCTSLVGFGQCPTTPIVLSSQADVDNFAINYPSCMIYSGTLTISGSDIIDLTPLSGTIFSVDLTINNNPLLTNLDGLNLIETPYSLYIINNPTLNNISSILSITNPASSNLLVILDNGMLTSLNGLQSFGNSSSLIQIDNNDSLTNLIGLENFSSINELYIENNDGLINFEGLSSLQNDSEYFVIRNNISLLSFDGITASTRYISDEFVIENNPILNDISAIENHELTCFSDCPFGDGEDIITLLISIKNNPNLSSCNCASLCVAIETWNPQVQIDFLIEIENNAEGCNSIAQVAFHCGLVPNNDDCDGALALTIGETLQA